MNLKIAGIMAESYLPTGFPDANTGGGGNVCQVSLSVSTCMLYWGHILEYSSPTIFWETGGLGSRDTV